MARRLIGLDVGTHAVTLAEVTPGSPPRLDRFGQVALPRDAMREGEVTDDAAVTEAIVRLKEEVDLKRAPVRIGISSPRLIVRQVEMPVMSRDELASALQFQAADLIPIPIDEAVLDFAILGTATSDEGESVMRVLLAAAQSASVMRLVAAVEAAGLPVGAVDLVPLALIRALGRPVFDDGAGAEGIVSFGGGVTSIAVHEEGVPRFVRVLGSGGRELTDAIAAELEVPTETAEALKRQLSIGGDDLVTRAQAAIERPLAVLLDEVRSSLDYYRNQPGAARMLRVVVTGGASQLPGVAERLAALVGVPVENARPRELVAIGDIRFPEEEFARLDPYLPAPVGLALGGAGVGTGVDLLPRTRRTRVAAAGTPSAAVGIAAAAALLVALAVPTFLAKSDVNDKKDRLESAQAENDALAQEIAAKQAAQQQQGQLEGLRAQVEGVLQQDVSWAQMLDEISVQIPDDVWLTSFQGQLTAAPVVAPAAGSTSNAGPTPEGSEGAEGSTGTTGSSNTLAAPTISGLATFQAYAHGYPNVSEWIRSLSEMPSFAQLWVSTATLTQIGERDAIEFSSTVQITDAARSDRLEQFRAQRSAPPDDVADDAEEEAEDDTGDGIASGEVEP